MAPTLGQMLAAFGSPAEWGAVSTAKLYWDDANSRLGIAVTPTCTLDVGGVVRFKSGSTGITIRYSNIASEEYDGVSAITFNYTGYQNGTTQFRNFGVYDGKQNPIMVITGSTQEAYFYGEVDALSFYDHTKFPETLEKAYAALASMEGKDGKVDHDKLHDYLRGWGMDPLSLEITPSRDIGATLSCLVAVVNDLAKKAKTP